MDYRMAIGYPDAVAPGAHVPSGFIERELLRIAEAMKEADTPEVYCQLYAAQQALFYALEPGGYAPPGEVILGGRIQPMVKDIQEGSAGCSAGPRRSGS